MGRKHLEIRSDKTNPADDLSREKNFVRWVYAGSMVLYFYENLQKKGQLRQTWRCLKYQKENPSSPSSRYSPFLWQTRPNSYIGTDYVELLPLYEIH